MGPVKGGSMKFKSLEEAAEAGLELVEKNALVYSIYDTVCQLDIYRRFPFLYSCCHDGATYWFTEVDKLHGFAENKEEFFYSEVE